MRLKERANPVNDIHMPYLDAKPVVVLLRAHVWRSRLIRYVAWIIPIWAMSLGPKSTASDAQD
jgi:hypothetical protein